MVTQAADSFVRAHRFSAALEGRVKDYYAHVAAENLLSADDRCLERLSPELREDVLLFMYNNLLQTMPFFAEKSTAFMLHVVQVLVTFVAPPGEFIVSAVRPSPPFPPTRMPAGNVLAVAHGSS